ncbi:hypothetical protein SAMN05880590_102743 [Rhizobium sp. RU35A]|uniref:hypothetical protein n=1 Tax=Rhizobium sp. RU35A TaxID=1907414 RepID=UPI000954C083|nr:hypothetical protein [Rhizobium sp. RU35A]SIQ23962.1 hypothetical protein SAMN05880590_102743 [Rhizobium sp. RU35A]
MTAKIQIICTSPGMRRNGVRHPASAFYDAGHWSDEQLAAFRADQNFQVREVPEGESTVTDADFEARVAAEVDARMIAKAEELQATFAHAVTEAAAEKIAALQSQLDDLQAKLQAAEKASAKK